MASFAVPFRHDGKQTSETFDDLDGTKWFKAEVEAHGPDHARNVLETMATAVCSHGKEARDVRVKNVAFVG